MSFFDLNIPFPPAGPDPTAQKNTRVKLVVKAMELGYVGVAHNRTIRGAVSDSDRCSIHPLPLSSLLKFAPALSASVRFHRTLLHAPLNEPFRQYNRLTVTVEAGVHAAALNSGNAVLRTYDLVAVRPLTQMAFDQACKVSEVDLISIDFSQKLPFRLKLPMVKIAIERGIFFEIAYSHLISDIQARRHMLAGAKLLVDWTQGKNLIVSSAACNASELRGPCDVANLSFLLGLSMERAKAAVSKNCRSLMASALRKKQFYKEAIKVERISNGELLNSFTWDPISSGEGDLSLDAMERSFSDLSKEIKSASANPFRSFSTDSPCFLSTQVLTVPSVEAVEIVDVIDEHVVQEEPMNDIASKDLVSKVQEARTDFCKDQGDFLNGKSVTQIEMLQEPRAAFIYEGCDDLNKVNSSQVSGEEPLTCAQSDDYLSKIEEFKPYTSNKDPDTSLRDDVGLVLVPCCVKLDNIPKIPSMATEGNSLSVENNATSSLHTEIAHCDDDSKRLDKLEVASGTCDVSFAQDVDHQHAEQKAATSMLTSITEDMNVKDVEQNNATPAYRSITGDLCVRAAVQSDDFSAYIIAEDRGDERVEQKDATSADNSMDEDMTDKKVYNTYAVSLASTLPCTNDFANLDRQELVDLKKKVHAPLEKVCEKLEELGHKTSEISVETEKQNEEISTSVNKPMLSNTKQGKGRLKRKSRHPAFPFRTFFRPIFFSKKRRR